MTMTMMGCMHPDMHTQAQTCMHPDMHTQAQTCMHACNLHTICIRRRTFRKPFSPSSAIELARSLALSTSITESHNTILTASGSDRDTVDFSGFFFFLPLSRWDLDRRGGGAIDISDSSLPIRQRPRRSVTIPLRKWTCDMSAQTFGRIDRHVVSNPFGFAAAPGKAALIVFYAQIHQPQLVAVCRYGLPPVEVRTDGCHCLMEPIDSESDKICMIRGPGSDDPLPQ
jgi:hypothetical protein